MSLRCLRLNQACAQVTDSRIIIAVDNLDSSDALELPELCRMYDIIDCLQMNVLLTVNLHKPQACQ